MAGTPAIVQYIAYIGGLGGTPSGGILCYPHSRCFTDPGAGFWAWGRGGSFPLFGRPRGFL